MKYIRFSFLILLFPVSLSAQTTGGTRDLGNEDIIIVKEYQPVLKDAFKINISPTGDTSVNNAPVMQYAIDPKPISSNYNITPIKPVRIKDDNIRKLYRGFIKGGYGLENMPLLDIYFNSLRAKEFDAGFSFHHLSSTGKIKDYGFPGNSENRFEAHGTRYFDRFDIYGKAGYDRDMVHYYGYKSPPDLFSKKETRHLMDGFNGDFGIRSAAGNDVGYNGGINFYTFSDNRKIKENNFGLQGGVSYAIEPGLLSVNASADFMNVEQLNESYNRSILKFVPRLTISETDYKLSAGANVAIEGNDGKTEYHLYPHVRGEYHVVNDAINVWAELSGDLERTDIRGISKKNPFFADYLPLANANHKIKVYGGTSIRLSHDLMFSASGGYSRITDMPFFYNTFDSLFPVTFSLIYDDIDLLNLRAALEFKRAEKFSAGMFIDYNNYGTDKLDKPLYVPALRFGFNGNYAMAEKIYVKADLFYNSELYGIAYSPEGNVSSTKLDGYFDANLGVDYRYNKILSVFVQLNNLGFAQYFRYYRYPNYRFTGMAGVTLAF